MIMHCPRCQSPNIVSNKWDDTQIARADNIAKAVQVIGKKELSILAGVGTVLFRALNAWVPAYRCLDCQYKFDE